MFTTKDRDHALTMLSEFCQNIESVQGLLLVGSGARGFTDKYSDLDVIVVTSQSADVPKVHDSLADFISDNFSVLRRQLFKHEEDIYVDCYLFDNFLELDLGIWSYNKIRATKPWWKVIFDKRDSIDAKLAYSLKSRPAPELTELTNRSLDNIWQYFRGAMVALKRNQLLLALRGIEIIRGDLINVVCVKNGVHHDWEKHIDQLDPNIVGRIRRTCEIKMTHDGLRDTLLDVVELYFEVMSASGVDVSETRKLIYRYLEEVELERSES